MQKIIKKQEGISLVALIITIIVMVILAGIIITAAVADGGIIDRAKISMRAKEEAEIEEIVQASIVIKKIASSSTLAYVDLGKTGIAIFENLTANGFEVLERDNAKDENGEYIKDENGEFVPTVPIKGNSIEVKVEGDHVIYEGTVTEKGEIEDKKVTPIGGSIPPGPTPPPPEEEDSFKNYIEDGKNYYVTEDGSQVAVFSREKSTLTLYTIENDKIIRNDIRTVNITKTMTKDEVIAEFDYSKEMVEQAFETTYEDVGEEVLIGDIEGSIMPIAFKSNYTMTLIMDEWFILDTSYEFPENPNPWITRGLTAPVKYDTKYYNNEFFTGDEILQLEGILYSTGEMYINLMDKMTNEIIEEEITNGNIIVTDNKIDMVGGPQFVFSEDGMQVELMVDGYSLGTLYIEEPIIGNIPFTETKTYKMSGQELYAIINPDGTIGSAMGYAYDVDDYKIVRNEKIVIADEYNSFEYGPFNYVLSIKQDNGEYKNEAFITSDFKKIYYAFPTTYTTGGVTKIDGVQWGPYELVDVKVEDIVKNEYYPVIDDSNGEIKEVYVVDNINKEFEHYVKNSEQKLELVESIKFKIEHSEKAIKLKVNGQEFWLSAGFKKIIYNGNAKAYISRYTEMYIDPKEEQDGNIRIDRDTNFDATILEEK